MSVFQPGLEPGPPTPSELPAFDVVRRGYDRPQVDAYVAGLAARLEEAGDRALEAERARAQSEREAATMREQRPGSFQHLGAEAAMVLEQAGREAAAVMERSGHSAELLVEKAQNRADTILTAAQEQAAELVKAAEARAGEFEAAARQRLVEVQAKTEQVQEFRDGLMRHLGRVRGDLDALLEQADQVDGLLGAGGEAPPAGEASGAVAERLTPVEAAPEAKGGKGNGAAPG